MPSRVLEAAYQAFFEESLSPMLIIDPPSGRIVEANAAACRFYGYSYDQLTAMRITSINCLDEAAVAEDMKRAQTRHANYFCFQHRLASGEIRDVDVYSSPIVADGRTLLASVIHDVTEHHRTQLAMEHALRVADEFLATAAHELKTPLTSLRGFSQTLLMLAETERLDSARSRRALHSIASQTERLVRIVDRLFFLSMIETGRLVLNPVPTDLTSMCEDIVAEAQKGTSKHAVTLQAHGPAVARVDAQYIEQVLRHLVENAIRFSPEPGPITVSITEPDARTIGVAVRDHGLGVPVERRELIFSRLGQAHADSYRSGLGLGLYVGRHIVERHGGSLAGEFPEDGGSLFTVLLPRAARPAQQVS